MRFSWGRIIRGTLFGLAVTAVLLNIGLAWFYVGALTKPACLQEPLPLAQFSAPDRILLQTSDGHLLPAWYYPSQNGAAVLAFGGLGGALGDNLPPVTPLLQAGYGVLQIGSRACADPPALVTLGYREGLDAAPAVAFLLGRTEVQPGRIGVFGFSMGGVAAIRAAARQPEISAVIAEGGYHNLGEDIVEADNQPAFWTRGFLYTIAATFRLRTGINPWSSSPVDDLPQISPRAILFIYGEQEVIDGRAFTQFEAAGEPKELWVVPGGGHGFNHLAAPAEYAEKIEAFFNQHLR